MSVGLTRLVHGLMFWTGLMVWGIGTGVLVGLGAAYLFTPDVLPVVLNGEVWI